MQEIIPPGQKYKNITPNGSAFKDFVKRIAANPDGARAVHLKLSKLQPQNKQPYHLRSIQVIMRYLGEIFNGQSFLLHNKDIIFVTGSCDLTKLQERIVKILDLFHEDPMSATPDGRKGFAEYYDLPDDLGKLQVFAENQLKEEERKRQQFAVLNKTTLNFQEEEIDVSPELVMRFEKALKSTDLSSFIRNQPVCKIESGKDPISFFHELYVSIPDLRETVFPELPITANSWLFQQMTETLDERMLILLCKYEPKALVRPLSLNLNISTVLSPLFIEFDELVQENPYNKIVIEFQKVDVYLDFARYYFARDFLHERGYKVCLDGLSALAMPLISREKLGCDFIKMSWGAELANFFSSKKEKALKEAIQQEDPKRIIMNRCDHQDAISYGHELGIQLFQGRLIDILVSK